MVSNDKASYTWHPIGDYESDPRELGKAELRSLAEVWNEQRLVLMEAEGHQQFNERLKREWAIETGLIERLYTLDRGITQTLIEKGINAALIPHQTVGEDPERIVARIRDHEDALDGLFAFVKSDRNLSTSYIKELHAILTRNQSTTTAVDSLGRQVEVELLRGDYKSQPNNPTRSNGAVHEYCPPEQVSSEMDRLVELHHSHGDAPPEVEAAWLHHRFTQIHPFQDGNGRVARCLATLVLIRAGWFPFVIRDVAEERNRYIQGLEIATRGDLVPLVSLFAAVQRRAFVQALGFTGQVTWLTQPDQVVRAVGEKLAAQRRAHKAEWGKTKVTAQRLQEIAENRFSEIAESLHRETRQYRPDFEFRVDREPEGGDRGHRFWGQIIELAENAGYYVNPGAYRAWVRLGLKSDIQSEILVSLHGTGFEYRGVLAVSAGYFRREEIEEGEREIRDLISLSPEIFQINYREQPSDAEARFGQWLEDILVRGLEKWRESL